MKKEKKSKDEKISSEENKEEKNPSTEESKDNISQPEVHTTVPDSEQLDSNEEPTEEIKKKRKRRTKKEMQEFRNKDIKKESKNENENKLRRTSPDAGKQRRSDRRVKPIFPWEW